jgi:S-DNA-T family DNA segregation ATPase FtsK/SpoIIIE
MATNHFTVTETLALLDSLKTAISDFAAREQKLNSDFRLKIEASQKAFDTLNRTRETKLAEQLDESGAGLELEKSACETRFERRKAAINRAHNAARNRVMDQITAEDQACKDKVREGSDTAEQHRDASLANAAATNQEFQQKLASLGESIDQIEISARKMFRGVGGFKKSPEQNQTPSADELALDENALFKKLEQTEEALRFDLQRFGGNVPAKLFRFFPIWLIAIVLLGFAAAVLVLPRFGIHTIPLWAAGAAGGAFVLVIVLFFIAKSSSSSAAKSIAENISKSRQLLDACHEKSVAHFQQEQERIKNEFDATIRGLNQEWKQRTKQLLGERGTRPAVVDAKARRATELNEKLYRDCLERIKAKHAGTLTKLQRESETQAQQTSEAHHGAIANLEAIHQTQWAALEIEWKNTIEPLWEKIRVANESADELAPDWSSQEWKNWQPPTAFKNAAKFGRIEIDLPKFVGAMPQDKRLALPCPSKISVPLTLLYPQLGSILFETSKTGGGSDDAVRAMNSIIFRLLAATPPGKLNFTIFDPVGLGENFAALMHLADYEEGSINSRIWTQQGQFEEKLAELNEHMEKVIQMYLRNEYATIAEYNAEAGTIAEKYHFLVIASFPVNFSDVAAKRLRNIAASGARCGVYTLIQWDQRHALPQDFVPDELRKNSVDLVYGDRGFEFAGRKLPGTQLLLDAPPSPEFATGFLHEAGRSSKNSTRVEVPFEQVAPGDSEIWSEETTEELRVPIGRSGATKLQYLEIGKGTRQHALIAGKTGSGKSTLFHVIITNLALWCSPEQVEFYLVDFKKGVEFKCYANRKLPHAKVVAVESDRAFGLSVLQKVDDELRRRGDLFRKVGAQDLAGYKRSLRTATASQAAEPMPRALLMIDEFQEFFTEEDRVSQGAAVLLDRIVRQGRAFGIHVLLGSQTLGGAYSLARATIGQMVIRIALQCNEADAYLIMDQDNPAPRLLSRPGEGIYNDSAGSIEGNSPFQAVWLSDSTRDAYLEKVRERADEKKFPGPFVFEGNAPANVDENHLLQSALESPATETPVQSRVWLGSPNSIKGPTEAVFQRQSGSNLLIVGQSEERAATILSVALVSLSAQFPPGKAKFIVGDSTPPGFPQREFLQRVSGAIPHEVAQMSGTNLAEVMGELSEELKRRAGDEAADAPEIFVLIQGLQNFKKLKQEDEFGFSSGSDEGANPAAIFATLITDGPAHGIHIIAACDTYNNLNRFVGRKALSEFENRVLFQMSASDSASLVDAPDASTLGMHRALLYNDREGYTEIFRPYSQPGGEWIESVEQQLKRSERV